MRVFRWLLGAAVSATLVLTAVPTPAQAGTEVELAATLHANRPAFPHATGFSVYEREGREREVTVTVRHIPRMAGTWVKVYVNLKYVGHMRVNRYGVARRHWETEHHQFVPFASADNRVGVRTAHGTLIALGRYHRYYHHHMH